MFPFTSFILTTLTILLPQLINGSININVFPYYKKEIKFALDEAEKQPEGTIFLIPLKLEECDVPERLQRWH
jgi:hypothetical protein